MIIRIKNENLSLLQDNSTIYPQYYNDCLVILIPPKEMSNEGMLSFVNPVPIGKKPVGRDAEAPISVCRNEREYYGNETLVNPEDLLDGYPFGITVKLWGQPLRIHCTFTNVLYATGQDLDYNHNPTPGRYIMANSDSPVTKKCRDKYANQLYCKGDGNHLVYSFDGDFYRPINYESLVNLLN